MNIVLDTNVLISSLINPNGSPSSVLNLILNEQITILYDNRIIHEYRNVLSRKKFNFSNEIYEPLLDFIGDFGNFIVAEPLKMDFVDKDDLKFYEVAVSGKARFLITGNIKHFPDDSLIITPANFIDYYVREK
ncbi:putative toxin-antitoxin system toxin component, PIN family [Spirochaeta dissipatitropha]